MISLTIDNQTIEVAEGTTILEAAEKLNIYIPTLCHHESLIPYGGCRLCVVEVSRNGTADLTSSCTYKVEEGLKVKTNTERVRKVRRLVLELLLAEASEAPILQDLAREMGVSRPDRLEPRKDDFCILCGRCVRACREVVGVNAIDYAKRGYSKKVAAPFFKSSPDRIACGTCFYICPTGAITVQEVEEGQKARIPGGEIVAGPARIIDNWKVGLAMKRCSKCGEIIAPEFQFEYLRKKVDLPEDHFDICPSCRE
ncbi:MAG: (2Fe-2S)-binding protein [Deltaproteobacteria bacterium]|nr:(2Fe-2S)-binding protein [Deltaproteobacteria bacterium]